MEVAAAQEKARKEEENKTNNQNIKIKKNKINSGTQSVKCYCGRQFIKKNGYVFNGEITINHCVSFEFYQLKLDIIEALGLSRKYLEMFSEYFCSQICCNRKGYRVADE